MKRLLLVATLVSAATLALSAWYSRHTASLARAERWQTQQEEIAAEALLDQPITLDGRHVTLAELCNLVADETGLEVGIDSNAIGPEKISFRLPIGTFTIRSALDRVLQPSYLDYTFHGSSLVITTQEATESDLHTVVYPLPQPMLTEVTEDEWVELIRETIEPSDWDEVGGRGHLETIPGAIVVVQTPRVHRAMRQLMDGLASLELPPDSLDPRPLLPRTDESSRRKLLAALNRPASINCMEQPMREVVAGLGREYGIALAIDADHLEEAGVSINQPVTLHLDDVSLRSLLRHLLHQSELALLDRGGSLVITTPEEAESHLHVVAYPVLDLVWVDGVADFDSLIEMITADVSPNSWDFSGPAFMPTLDAGWLVIPQTAEVHEEIESLLHGLRTGIAQGGEPEVRMARELTPAAERIRAALRRPIALDYDRVPLRELFQRLSQELGIEIVLDDRSVLDAGVMFDPPITWHMPAIPLKSQIFWMLRTFDLMWIVEKESLVITSTAEAEAQQITRLYDLRNLTDPDLGLSDARQNVETWIEKLVAPGSWESGRGWGSMTEFRGLLVVTQRPEVHEELTQFLVAVEKHCRKRSGSPRDTPLPVRISPSPTAGRIERVLAENISVSYCGVPLEELLRDVAGRLELPVAFDRAAVVIEGYDFQEIVSFSAHERPLAEILDALFATNEFAYEIRSDVLFFTFKSRHEQEPQTRLYRVRDLLSPDDPAGLENLAQRLTAADAYYWDSNQGGSGAVVPLGTEWLAISADWRMHQVVEDWLTEQRTGQQPLRAIERAKRLELQTRQGHVRREISAGRFPITIP